MNHLDEGMIHAWLDGALDAAQARDVEAHVATCATCRAAVADARGLIAGASRILTALDDVPGGVIPGSARSAVPPRARGVAGPRRWHTSRWVTGIAAALMLAVGVTTYNRRAVQKEMSAPAVATTAAPVEIRRGDTPDVAAKLGSARSGGTAGSMSSVGSAPPSASAAPPAALPAAAPTALAPSAANVVADQARARETRQSLGGAVEGGRGVAASRPPEAPTMQKSAAFETRAASAAPMDAAVADALDLAEYAGCYGVPDRPQIADVVVTAAPSARTEAADAKSRRRAAADAVSAPAAAPAPAAASGVAPAPAFVPMPPRDSSYVVLRPWLSAVQLDTTRDAPAVATAQARAYREVGRWTPVGRDSVRIVMNGRAYVVARTARMRCP